MRREAAPPTLDSPGPPGRSPERVAAWLTLGLLAALLLLINGGGWLALARLHRALESELETRLITTGRTVAATISAENFLILGFRQPDGTLDVDLIRSWQGDSAYLDLLILLDRTKEAANLRSIALITPALRVVADPDDPAAVGQERAVFALDQEQIQNASEGRPAACPLYSLEDVLYKRVYVPVYDEENRPLALLRLEAGSEYFHRLERLGHTLTLVLVSSTLVLLLVSWIFYRLLNRVLRAERAAYHADRLRSLGTLSAGLAHEIRNPLAIIKLTCEELRTAVEAARDIGTSGGAESSPALATSLDFDPADRDRLVHDIQEEVLRLEALVDQFLSFARPEAVPGKGAERPTTDPVAVVRQVLRLFEKGLRSTRIRLEIAEPSEPLPAIPLSEKQLSQVLLNLLRNAAEAIGTAEGTIAVSLRSAKNRPGNLEIEVRDDGPGMPETIRRQAFEPFFSTREGGTGLGLPLVQRLVTTAGGEVDLESRAGSGTAVTVRLPAVQSSDL